MQDPNVNIPRITQLLTKEINNLTRNITTTKYFVKS